MHFNMTKPLGQVTGPPYVTLVDLDGFAVPVGEKDVPEFAREPQPADSWPAWTDLVRVALGRRDFEHRIGGSKFGDAYREVLERADACAADGDEPPDDDRRIPRGAVLVPPELEEYEPTAEDLAEYGDWLEGLDREQVAAMTAPIRGGSPDDDDPMAFPRLKTAADRRRDRADVCEFYRTHPGA